MTTKDAYFDYNKTIDQIKIDIEHNIDSGELANNSVLSQKQIIYTKGVVNDILKNHPSLSAQDVYNTMIYDMYEISKANTSYKELIHIGENIVQLFYYQAGINLEQHLYIDVLYETLKKIDSTFVLKQ